jgi:H+/Cl- antiporter ClcA
MDYQNAVVDMTLKLTKDWYIGLIMGLLLGIFGNLFSAYLMKYFDSLGLQPWMWGVSAALCFVLVLVFIWFMWTQAKKADSQM